MSHSTGSDLNFTKGGTSKYIIVTLRYRIAGKSNTRDPGQLASHWNTYDATVPVLQDSCILHSRCDVGYSPPGRNVMLLTRHILGEADHGQ